MKIVKWAKGKIINVTMGYIMRKVLSDDFKQYLVAVINEKVDLPKLNEKQEARLIKALIETLAVYITPEELLNGAED